MTTLTENIHDGAFLMAEANGTISRETVTVASGRSLKAGTVIMLNGSSKAVLYDGATASTVLGVLLYAVDATSADVAGAVYIARHAEVRSADLTVASGKLTLSVAGLKALGIIAR